MDLIEFKTLSMMNYRRFIFLDIDGVLNHDE